MVCPGNICINTLHKENDDDDDDDDNNNNNNNNSNNNNLILQIWPGFFLSKQQQEAHFYQYGKEVSGESSFICQTITLRLMELIGPSPITFALTSMNCFKSHSLHKKAYMYEDNYYTPIQILHTQNNLFKNPHRARQDTLRTCQNTLQCLKKLSLDVLIF
jgi:hypothetical protein